MNIPGVVCAVFLISKLFSYEVHPTTQILMQTIKFLVSLKIYPNMQGRQSSSTLFVTIWIVKM